MDTIPQKVCRKCGIAKPATEYYVFNGKLSARCKECNRADDREAYWADRSASLEKLRIKRQRQAKQRAAYRERTREQRNAYNSAWRKKNPGKTLAHVHARRARKNGNGGTYLAVEWEELKRLYGHRCLACGRAEPNIKLVIDHVIPLARGGENTICNIQPLCATCNDSKGSNIADYRDSKIDARLVQWQAEQDIRPAKTNPRRRYTQEHRRQMAEQAAREYPGLIGPDGVTYAPIRNLRAFCAEHDLAYFSIWDVARGRRRIFQGWTRYQPEK